MSVWLHPDAESELGDAAVHYAEQAGRAVAEAFLVEFERIRDLLIENPQRGPWVEHGLRIYHFDRFPYSVVYESDAQGALQIFAIAHQRRGPGYWVERL